MVNAWRLPVRCALGSLDFERGREKRMFNAVLEFVMQISVLYPLVGMFILIDLLLWANRTRRFNEVRERREADRIRNEERRERRKLG